MRDLFDLTGRIAVITGGGGLLGLQHAEALLQNNCDVDLWDIDLENLAEKSKILTTNFPNRNITTKMIDISDENQLKKLLNQPEYLERQINILVNNAAINPKFDKNNFLNSRFENYPLAQWNEEIAVGLTGAMLCSRYLGQKMAINGGGVILNIASDLSVISPDQRIYEKSGLKSEYQFKKPVSYSVIKAGLVGLTKYLSTYWATEHVRVNALSPGGVFESQDDEFVQKISNLIPLGRMAKKGEYKGAVQFLCSDASEYLTGQNIVMDGGRSVW